jgi:hypothetical protein
MKLTKILMVCMAVLFSGSVFGQKIKVINGDMKALKGVTALKIEYDYSDLGVGKFEVEDDYIAKKVAEMNEDEAGTGDSWKEKWFADRPERYEPKYEELFNKYAESIEAGQDVESDVTMDVHTTFLEPGFNVGVARKPAFINLEISFIRGGEALAVIEMLKCPGSDAWGFDFDTGYRISEAYAKAGKAMARYLLKYTQ